MIRTLIAVLLVASAFVHQVLQAQDAPYTGLETRAIKALSSEQIDEYRRGHGMGFALAAELNGYPGPKHVLELKDKLALTSAQQTRTEELFEQMHAAAVALGEAIIEREAALDALFDMGAIDKQTLEEHLAEIATLNGKLRTVHLAAHLETKKLLSEQQIDTYNRLRGYGGHSPQQHQQHQGHGGP